MCQKIKKEEIAPYLVALMFILLIVLFTFFLSAKTATAQYHAKPFKDPSEMNPIAKAYYDLQFDAWDRKVREKDPDFYKRILALGVELDKAGICTERNFRCAWGNDPRTMIRTTVIQGDGSVEIYEKTKFGVKRIK